jgi:hypothetical protein
LVELLPRLPALGTILAVLLNLVTQVFAVANLLLLQCADALAELFPVLNLKLFLVLPLKPVLVLRLLAVLRLELITISRLVRLLRCQRQRCSRREQECPC